MSFFSPLFFTAMETINSTVKILYCLGEMSWRFKNSWLTGAYAGDYTVSVMNWSVFYCSEACFQHTSRFTITHNSSRLHVIYHTLFLLLLSDPSPLPPAIPYIRSLHHHSLMSPFLSRTAYIFLLFYNYFQNHCITFVQWSTNSFS